VASPHKTPARSATTTVEPELSANPAIRAAALAESVA
jgi:hypothetical protein